MKETDSQFQVGYVSNTGLNVNRAFKEKNDIIMAITLESITMVLISKVLIKQKTRVISLLVFYENRKSMILIF